MIELLAPAKDKICAKAAVDSGADAIYIGASSFGARKKASNTLSEIKEVVDYAHRFNVKVYAAINTILTDEEVLKAKDLIDKLSEISIDAIIIQDMGLLEIMAKEDGEKVSNLPIHASTQCDNRTLEKVKFLEDVGFTRVILARELSLEQISEIRKHTNVELETFIHGALCVSYSGQCYLSYMIGGRSANRGECAQPCRKKYSLKDEDGNFIAKNQYLLCLKDFNASAYIENLVNAGITSLKIEGRLKDEYYVKNVVGYYRKLIDKLAQDNPAFKKTSSGKIIFDFEPDLNKSFNRGFTDYFLTGRSDCHSFSSPKSKGEYVGKVSKVGKDYFEITFLNSKLSALNHQDGLCFFDEEELGGCLVNKIVGNKVYPNKANGIKVGMDIYRNFDFEFDKKLKNSKTCRKILAKVEFDAGKVAVEDEDRNFVEINYNFEEFADNREKMEINIINQLKKTGETDFLVDEVIIKADNIPFLPISRINELRRELLQELMKKRTGQKENNNIVFSSKPDAVCPQSEIDYKGNVLNKYAKSFYEKYNCIVSEPALESVRRENVAKSDGQKCVMTAKHCLKHSFNMCKSPKKLYLIDEKDKEYELKFNCKKCEMEVYF